MNFWETKFKRTKIRMTLDYNQIKIFKKIIKKSFFAYFSNSYPSYIYLSTWITHHSARLRFQTDFTQVHIVMLHTFLIYIWYTLHKSRFFLLWIIFVIQSYIVILSHNHILGPEEEVLMKNSRFRQNVNFRKNDHFRGSSSLTNSEEKIGDVR